MPSLINKLKMSRYMQYLAVFSAALSSSSSYMVGTWGSPSIPKLTSPNSPIGVTLDHKEVSWVASSPLLGYILGSLITPIVLNAIGPKRSLLLAVLPVTVSWFGIALSKSIIFLILMRFMAGAGNGAVITVLPLYIGKVSDKDIRGKLTTFYPIFSSLGSIFVLSVGPFVTYRTLALTCSIFPMAFMTIFYFMPYSPYFLIKNGRLEEGKRCLRRLSAQNFDHQTTDERLNEIELTVIVNLGRKMSIWRILSERHFRIALFLNLNLKFILAFSGIGAVKSFLQTIIGTTTSNISPEESSLISGIVQLPSAFLVDKVGRKLLLVVSTAGCAITLGIGGVYFYLQDVVKADVDIVSWLPTTCIAIYLVALPIGIITVSGIIAGEIFADDVKSVSAALSTTFYGFWTFLITNFFLPMADRWGMCTVFWIFSGACIYGTLFGLFVLPETKGKSFMEIQNLLKNKRHC